MRRARRIAPLAAAVAALAIAAPAQAVIPGAIDSRFASCGQATGLVPRDMAARQFSYGAGAALAAQPDGKVVAAGPAARGMGATRFNADGTLDTSFGGDGVAFVPSPGGGSGDQTQVTSVAVQPDGKVVAAGWLRSQGGDGPATALVQRFLIARFTPSGEPDTTFSGDGVVEEAPAGAATASVHGIATAAGGALIVAGQVDERFTVARYRDDGTLDTGFGTGGLAQVTSAGRPNGRANAAAVLPDGRILAAGQTNAEIGEQAFTVARFSESGAPDPGFGGTGVITETFDESSVASALVPQPDGRAYAVGTSIDLWGDDEGGGTTRRVAAVRYLANGDRDDSFAGDGSVLDALGQGLYAEASPHAAAVDGDGRLAVTTGRTLARYTPGGARDTSFGRGGLLRLFSVPTGESLVALPDGALVLGGGNGRQGTRPAGFEFGPAILRLVAGGTALERAGGQPGACFLRVRNPSLTHLLRRGRVARYGKLLVGAFLTQPGRGLIVARAVAGGRTFTLGRLEFESDFAGGTAFELPLSRSARLRLRGLRKARIHVVMSSEDTSLQVSEVRATLRR